MYVTGIRWKNSKVLFKGQLWRSVDSSSAIYPSCNGPTRLEGEEDVEDIRTYQEAVLAAVKHMEIDRSQRNVLLAHQFVVGAMQCDSEEISVGGIDQIEAEVFRDFDYVALGHIHSPQNVGSPKIRYCGTPLKYSFSEAGQQKSVTVVELGEKEALMYVRSL